MEDIKEIEDNREVVRSNKLVIKGMCHNKEVCREVAFSKVAKVDSRVVCREAARHNRETREEADLSSVACKETASIRALNREEEQASNNEEMHMAGDPQEVSSQGSIVNHNGISQRTKVAITIGNLRKVGTTTDQLLLAADKVATTTVRLHKEVTAVNQVTGHKAVTTSNQLGDKVADTAVNHRLDVAGTTISQLLVLVVKVDITTSLGVAASTISSGTIITPSLAIGNLQVNSKHITIHKLFNNHVVLTSKAALTSNLIVHELQLRRDRKVVHQRVQDNKVEE